jgi:hypothetical protein
MSAMLGLTCVINQCLAILTNELILGVGESVVAEAAAVQTHSEQQRPCRWRCTSYMAPKTLRFRYCSMYWQLKENGQYSLILSNSNKYSIPGDHQLKPTVASELSTGCHDAITNPFRPFRDGDDAPAVPFVFSRINA